MELLASIKAAFGAVYLLNGSFVEKADSFRYGGNEPLYITVLPLDARHLPYTVKISGKKAVCNEPLAKVYDLGQSRLYIRLMPRLNYVYSPLHKEITKPSTIAEKFFNFIKQGNIALARACLTPDLNETIGDKDLLAFFDDYKDIIENSFDNNANGYFLIDKNDCGLAFSFEIVHNLINNIVQKD